ncbi:MAG: hypothetical protein NVS2B16_06970 [Chloroflexota bacterium]
MVDSDFRDLNGLLSTTSVAGVVCGAGVTRVFLDRVRTQYTHDIIKTGEKTYERLTVSATVTLLPPSMARATRRGPPPDNSHDRRAPE